MARKQFFLDLRLFMPNTHYVNVTNKRRSNSGLAGACEYGDELSGSIKCGEFLD